jgi:signal-transduction protein with cAMP-binding, CBS, and nucleotidyltransferase domain
MADDPEQTAVPGGAPGAATADDPEQTSGSPGPALAMPAPGGAAPSVRRSALFSHLFSRRKKAPDTAQILGEIPLFDMLSTKELKVLAAMVHERSYDVGELICEQGTPGAAMYIVKQGVVELFRQDSQGRQIRRLGLLEAGSFFGEGALLEGTVRYMSARAIEPVEALVFFRADLDSIVARMPTTGTKILRKLAWVISRMMESAIEELYREQEG